MLFYHSITLFQDNIITMYCSGHVPSAVPGRLDLLRGGGGQQVAKEQSARGVRRHAPPEDIEL